MLVDFTSDELREIRDCINQSTPNDEFHERLLNLHWKVCEELGPLNAS